MGEATLVKADKELVRQAHELGANIKKLVDLMLEDYIRRNKCLKPETRAGKRATRETNGGTIVEETEEAVPTTQITTSGEDSKGIITSSACPRFPSFNCKPCFTSRAPNRRTSPPRPFAPRGEPQTCSTLGSRWRAQSPWVYSAPRGRGPHHPFVGNLASPL